MTNLFKIKKCGLRTFVKYIVFACGLNFMKLSFTVSFRYFPANSVTPGQIKTGATRKNYKFS